MNTNSSLTTVKRWLVVSGLLVMSAAYAADGSLVEPLNWAFTYGGLNTEREHAQYVTQTRDGGYLVTGSTTSFGVVGIDLWLVKLNPDGSIAWEKTYGGSGYEDAGWFVEEAKDGGYILAGQTNSFDSGSEDLWLLKLNNDGSVAWQKTYGGSGTDNLSAFASTADGGYLLGGETTSFGAGDYDVWLVKVASDGAVQWQKTYGGVNNDMPAWGILQTEDGGYVVTADTWSFGAGSGDVWVLRLDAVGAIVWQKTYGGPADEYSIGLRHASDGGYIVAGNTLSFGAGARDDWVLKLDVNGNVMWQKAYGGGGNDSPEKAFQTTVDGGYILGGFTDSFGAGGLDFWVVELTSAGNIIWQKTYGGIGDDLGISIDRTNDNGFVVAGVTSSFGVGTHDWWVLKVDEHGNIPNCGLERESNAIVTDTHAIVHVTSVIPQPTFVDPVTSFVTPKNSNATQRFQCRGGPPPSTFGFAVKPTALAFGNQALFTNTTLSIWVTNKGTAQLPITSVGLVGLNPGMFSANNRCGSSLAVGASCSIRVTFRPTSVDEKSAKLRVVAGDNDIRTKALSGKGVRSPFTVSPTALDFGSVPIGTTTAPKVVTISNTGRAVLPISSIALGGWYPYQFAQTHNCPANLAVGATCKINVVFKPTKTGSKAALVQITPGGGAGAIRSVALAGGARN